MSLKELSDNLIIASKFWEPIFKAGPDLERIGSLEQYEKSLKDSVSKLKDDQAAINIEIKTSYDDLAKKTKEEVDKITVKNKASDDLKVKVEQYRKDKVKEGEEIINNANLEQQKMLDEARKIAKNIIDDAEKINTAKKVELKDTQTQLFSINAAIDARNKILSELNKKLGALQKEET